MVAGFIGSESRLVSVRVLCNIWAWRILWGPFVGHLTQLAQTCNNMLQSANYYKILFHGF